MKGHNITKPLPDLENATDQLCIYCLLIVVDLVHSGQ